jgi:transcriptional regulator with XRE-family HTH domain
MNQHEALMQATCAVLRELREKKGLTQYDLARLSGLHRSYIGDVERGSRSLSVMNVARLAEHLGVSASSLVKLAERKMEEFKFVRLKPPESKTQAKVVARIKTMAKELASSQTKVKALTKALAQANAKAQVLAKAQAKAWAKAKSKAEAEARKRAAVRTKTDDKPAARLRWEATTRRCISGHRWTGVRTSCPTCHFPGFLINP